MFKDVFSLFEQKTITKIENVIKLLIFNMYFFN